MTARSRVVLGAGAVCLVAWMTISGSSLAAPGCVDLSIRQWAVRLVPDEADVQLQLRLVVVNWGTEPVREIPRLSASWASPRGGQAMPLAEWSMGSTEIEGLEPQGMSEVHVEAPSCWWLPFPRSEYAITVRLHSGEDAFPGNNTLRIVLDEIAVRGLVRGEMGVWGPEETEAWLQGQVVGMRHTQNSGWVPWQSTVLDPQLRPWGLRQLRSSDLGAPVHCGFDTWTADHDTWPRVEEFYIPPGVVFGFCDTSMILNRSIQAPYLAEHRVQAGAIHGADGRVVLRRLIGPDLGAPAGVGYAWYETTEEGYEGQWEHLAADIDALPRGTVLVVRHPADPRHTGKEPGAAASQGYARRWQLPAGTWREISPLDADARQLLTTWPPWREWPRLNNQVAFVVRNGGDRGAPAGVGWSWFEKVEAAVGSLRPRVDAAAPGPVAPVEVAGPLVVLLGTPERVQPGQEDRIEVTVKSPTGGEPLAGAEVTLRCDGGSFVDLGGGEVQRFDGTTDAQGRFEVAWRAESADAYPSGITEHLITASARSGLLRGSNSQKILVTSE